MDNSTTDSRTFYDVARRVVDGLPGIRLFSDVFRRADKNDDGSLDSEEFCSYFQSSVLSDEELTEVFSKIDTAGNGTVSVDELCEFFMCRFDTYGPVFQLIEDVSDKTNEALTKSFKEYEGSSSTDQFRDRVLLNCAHEAIESLSMVYQTATHKMEDLSRGHPGTFPESVAPEDSFTRGTDYRTQNAGNIESDVNLTTRAGRRAARRKASLQEVEGDNNMPQPDFDGTSALVNEHGEENETEYVYGCEKYIVKEGNESKFSSVMESYMIWARTVAGCHNIQLRGGKGRYKVFSLWGSDALAMHRISKQYKNVRKEISALLDAPVECRTMTFGEETFGDHGPSVVMNSETRL